MTQTCQALRLSSPGGEAVSAFGLSQSASPIPDRNRLCHKEASRHSARSHSTTRPSALPAAQVLPSGEGHAQ
jgi:hypothetical protein